MIIIITGNQGSGKTLFGVRWCYNNYLKGDNIYSNLKLNFPHKMMKFNELMQCKYNNATILIDEAHLWGLDSRRSFSKINTQLTAKFVVQTRKRGVTLIVVTQKLRQIETRVRSNADYHVEVRKKVLINGKFETVSQSSEYESDVPVVIEAKILDIQAETFGSKKILANDYYGLYDTVEVIEMIDEYGSDDVVRVNAKQKKKKINKKKIKDTSKTQRKQ